MSNHKNLSGEDLHSLVAYMFADSTALAERTNPNTGLNYVDAEIGRMAWQLDDDTYWLLAGTEPTWTELGATGRDGADGADGVDGADGRDGADGADGTNGVDGADGRDGNDGATGADGADGTNGNAGPDGVKGDTGTAGQDGAEGLQGIQGQQGVAGVAGSDGVDGVIGGAGADGSDGADGVAGAWADLIGTLSNQTDLQGELDSKVTAPSVYAIPVNAYDLVQKKYVDDGFINDVSMAGDLTVAGNLTIEGTTTTINSTTVDVEDKNITLGNVAPPTDLTADGGGITLKGSTDKTILWDGGSGTWDFNQNVHVEGYLSITGTFVGDGSGITDIDHDMHLPLGGATSGSDGNTGNFGWTSLGTFPPLDTSNAPPLGFISRGAQLRLILDLGSDQKLSGMLYQNYVLTSGTESERGLRSVTVYSSTVAPSTGWNEVLGDLTTQFVGDLERETEAPHLSALKLVPFTSGTIGRYIIIDASGSTLSSWGSTWKGMRAMLAQVADSPVYESQFTTLVADSLSNVGDLNVNSLTTVQSVVVGTGLVVGGNVSVGGMIQSGDGLNTGMGTNTFASIRVDLGAFNNTAIGSNAAFTLTSGSNNIIIGANAQTTTPTTSDQIVIGTPAQTRCIIYGAIEGNGENLTNISCSAVVREQGYLRLSTPHLLQQQGALGGSWVTSSYTDSPADTAGIIASRGFNLLVGKTYELTCHLHGIGGFQDWLIAYWVKEGETTPCGWATKGGIQMEQATGGSGFSSITGPITTTITPSATSRYHIWVVSTSGFMDLYSQGAVGTECTMHAKEV